MESYAGYMMALGIILGVASFVYLVLMFFQFKHIRTAINVIDAAAEFCVGNKRVVLIPFVYFSLIIAMWIGWANCMVAIISLN